MKQVLIDGSNLSLIHLASNPALDINGEPVGLLKGFLSAVISVNRLMRPDSITIFFDGPGGSLQRRQIYKDYKSGRKPRTLIGGKSYQYLNEDQAAANKDRQMEILQRLLGHCGINVITTDSYESDDGIAYIISQNKEDKIVIVSCDKDFYQLLSENVQIYNPISKKIVTTDCILAEFGIHPNNWLLYRAISGDKSDNISGVRGFGPKTLKKLFLLNGEKKVELDTISECVLLLTQEKKLDNSEKTLLKRFLQLESNLGLIKRNCKLMDLSDPLMAPIHKQKIQYKIDNFKPTLSQKDFYLELKEVGGLGINAIAPNDFVKLARKI